MARFVAYSVGDVERASELLRNPGQMDVGAAKVAWGTKLEVVLSGPGLAVEGGASHTQRFIWTGQPVVLTFEVEARNLQAHDRSLLRFDVVLDGFVLARIRLELAIGTSTARPRYHSIVGNALSRRAFASYSSSDRQRVLDRVAAIRIAAAVQVFLDCHDLNPGDAWKPRLEAEIDGSDAFMLFWSDAAAKSRWVRWEWERAYRTLGLEKMQFHPLENGVRPPPSLASIHLADILMDARTAETARIALKGCKGTSDE